MANEAQATFWTETVGHVWLEREAALEGASIKFGEAAIDAAGIRGGEQVLDVGCGTGATTIELARRAGPDGSALGVDISTLFVERARERAAGAGADNVSFLEADAQTHDLGAESRDVVFSRFGVMFFEDPVAAFANLLRTLRPGGRLAFACWQNALANLWMSLPTLGAASVLGPPEFPGPTEPGPFSLEDADRIRSVLSDAGFDAIDVVSLESPIELAGETARQWVLFVVRMGPLRDAYEQADDELRERTNAAILEAVAPYESDGTYRLPAAAWIVTAKRP